MARPFGWEPLYPYKLVKTSSTDALYDSRIAKWLCSALSYSVSLSPHLKKKTKKTGRGMSSSLSVTEFLFADPLMLLFKQHTHIHTHPRTQTGWKIKYYPTTTVASRGPLWHCAAAVWDSTDTLCKHTDIQTSSHSSNKTCYTFTRGCVWRYDSKFQWQWRGRHICTGK